jgi:hypothetical protein
MIKKQKNMRKQLVFLLVIIAGINLVWSQPSVDKKTKAHIVNNKIKTQTNWEYKYEGDKPEKNGVRTSVTRYNPSGEIAEVTTYNSKGVVINVEKYRYDAAGNKLEYSRYTGGNEKQIAYQKISKYNSRNDVVEETGYDGVEKFHNKYSYDNNGNLKEILYEKNGSLVEKRVFKKEGLKTNVSIYNATGNMISRIELTYDNKNNLLEETVYGVNQDIIEKKTYDYDEKKNLKAESKYKLNKITLRTTYNYNINNDLAEIWEEPQEGGKFLKKSFTYNEKGYITEIKWRRKSSEDFNSIKYFFDNRGLCTHSETFYPSTNYKVMTKYTYEYF